MIAASSNLCLKSSKDRLSDLYQIKFQCYFYFILNVLYGIEHFAGGELLQIVVLGTNLENMTHFNFETEVNELIRLDGAINYGPIPRWQRKAEEAEVALSSKSSTPNKLVNRSTNKTPSRSPNKKTPGKQKTPKTPSGDRFIPSRSSMNMDTSYFKVMGKEEAEQENEGSPSKAEFRKSMSENLCANELNAKILTYTNKAPVPREGKYFICFFLP